MEIMHKLTRKMIWNSMLHCVRLWYDVRQPRKKPDKLMQGTSIERSFILGRVVDAKKVELSHEQSQTMNNYFVQEEKQSVGK